ncbi:HD-GYP domain-containing protein [Ethanoligenens harbinense]|uniref:Metal dependent phosphohydrolase n=1 Tax=Ethanoligenens harbinense (strain DSM 18485 / JCM 12961 / CGMCC 1.5033 / YUAN-3) TaxID=663278 RepID=E6U9Y6_ETHHY|nr:HD-GYP domain-containing protein [Ethanoligenens harbinense]ADU26252.1 metal dependent phosphohydrolase [Ethanoligenens harbinense YUAN-3]AVQ95387.1 HD-GYP domain-containing protein [Ethanoligenens harbinense YUAN-3]AYF38052.1 HD-GYP domain-containing protein [Ethanoligenens harbinense]AYF40797.1 HD-GYP domain-containing protein [Ethanoligenens harbinense]QCN91628.1 HD-GYP domain-containing protein [Ethanoligenens harbinense]
MRFISVYCLRNGMTLGRDLYGKNGELLLGNGQVLQESYIERILALGYHGVYICDNLSGDIEIQETVNQELRMKAVTTVRDTFIITRAQGNVSDAMENTKAIVRRMIEEILSHSNAMINMVDMKVFDDYTFFHSVNVTVLSLVMGVSLGFPESKLIRLGLGALLHDIGKVFIDKKILDKPGPLDDEEMEEMNKHAALGYEFLRDHSELPVTSYVAVLQHHERYDGTGYPYGLKGEEISEFARIIAVADVYDALNSDRPYRRAILASNAMEYIMGGSGTHFDPLCVETFVRKVAAFPLGTVVRLSNGMSAIVVRNYADCCIRPSVRVLSGEWQGRIISLRDDHTLRNVTISEVLDV